eukprot:g4303.t1
MAVSAAEAGRNERMHAWAMHTLLSQECTDAQFLLKLDGIFAEVFQDISFRGSADPAAMAELKSRAETLTELPESKLSQIFENAQQLAQTATEKDMENARAAILDVAQRTIVGSLLSVPLPEQKMHLVGWVEKVVHPSESPAKDGSDYLFRVTYMNSSKEDMGYEILSRMLRLARKRDDLLSLSFRNTSLGIVAVSRLPDMKTSSGEFTAAADAPTGFFIGDVSKICEHRDKINRGDRILAVNNVPCATEGKDSEMFDYNVGLLRTGKRPLTLFFLKASAKRGGEKQQQQQEYGSNEATGSSSAENLQSPSPMASVGSAASPVRKTMLKTLLTAPVNVDVALVPVSIAAMRKEIDGTGSAESVIVPLQANQQPYMNHDVTDRIGNQPHALVDVPVHPGTVRRGLVLWVGHFQGKATELLWERAVVVSTKWQDMAEGDGNGRRLLRIRARTLIPSKSRIINFSYGERPLRTCACNSAVALAHQRREESKKKESMVCIEYEKDGSTNYGQSVMSTSITTLLNHSLKSLCPFFMPLEFLKSEYDFTIDMTSFSSFARGFAMEIIRNGIVHITNAENLDGVRAGDRLIAIQVGAAIVRTTNALFDDVMKVMNHPIFPKRLFFVRPPHGISRTIGKRAANRIPALSYHVSFGNKKQQSVAGKDAAQNNASTSRSQNAKREKEFPDAPTTKRRKKDAPGKGKARKTSEGSGKEMMSASALKKNEKLKKVIQKQTARIRDLEETLKLSQNSRHFGLERLILSSSAKEAEQRVREALQHCCQAKSSEFVLKTFRKRFIDTFHKYATSSVPGVTTEIQVGTADVGK